MRRLLLVLAGVTVVLACASCPEEPGLTVGGRLKPCPSSPNCVGSEEPGRSWSIEPFAYAGEGGEAFSRLLELVGSDPQAEVVEVAGGYAHAVYRTPLLRFRDDLELLLDESAGVIHVRSASRLGYSDLGTNRQRVERLRERWRAASKP